MRKSPGMVELTTIYKPSASRYDAGSPFYSMQTFRFVFLACVALFSSTLAVRGQEGEDPSDQYFRGYVMSSDAERAEQGGNLQAALSKYQQAQAVFNQIAQATPGWQPEMLKFRRDKIADAMTALQAKIAAAPPPAPAAPAPAPAVVVPQAASPVAIPQIPQYPQPAPAVTPGASPTNVEDAMNVIKKAIEAQAAQKNQEVQEARAAAGSYAIAYQTALKQRDELATTFQTLAATDTALKGRVAELEKQVASGAGAKGELDKLRAEASESNAQLAESKQRLDKSQKAVMNMTKDLTEAQTRLAAVEKEHKELTQKLDEKTRELEAATKQNQLLAQQRDDAVKKNQELSTQLGAKAAGPGSDDFKKLVADNERLRKDLETARQQVETLKGDASNKDKEIAQLKGQLTQIQGELAGLKRENAAYESQVSELTLNLKKLRSSMDEPKKGKHNESAQLLAENQLLRGIVIRQLRVQAREQQKKAAVIAEIQQTENASKDLIDQVAQLGGPRFSLTADEQKLFTTPQLQEVMGDGGIQATIIAKGNDSGKSAPKKTDETGNNGAAAVDGLLAKGNQALQDGKFADAAAAYEDVLRADPKNSSGFAGLAWTRVQQNKLDEAEVTLKKSLAYDANNATAHYMLGVTMFRRNRLNEAMSSFEKSLDLNAKNARARHYLGVICSKMGLPPRAEREFKAALAIDPEYGEAYFNLAVLYVTWDPPKWDDARKNYREAVKKGVPADPNLEKILEAGGGPAVSTR